MLSLLLQVGSGAVRLRHTGQHCIKLLVSRTYSALHLAVFSVSCSGFELCGPLPLLPAYSDAASTCSIDTQLGGRCTSVPHAPDMFCAAALCCCRRRETEDEVQMLQRLLLLRDVAAGMEFLHSKNIVHSDLVSLSATSFWAAAASMAEVADMHCLAWCYVPYVGAYCGSCCVLHRQCLGFAVLLCAAQSAICCVHRWCGCG
jgi:hypothetical protein